MDVVNSSKKKICMITTWYPTKENPFAGSFFKEQAIIMEQYFDFIVVRPNVQRKGILSKKEYCLSFCNEEKNTVEYNLDINISLWYYIKDLINIVKYRLIKKDYGTDYYRVFRRKKTDEILNKVFIDNKDKLDFDILYCVDAQNEAEDLFAVSRAVGKPYVVSEHAPFPWPGHVINNHQKNAIEKANMFMAISNDKIRQIMLQNIKLPKTVNVGNLVNEKMFMEIPDKSDGIKTFIIVAAYSYYKNFDLFIAVMNRLREITDVPFKVKIVGYKANKGYSVNPEELEEKVKASKFLEDAELIPAVAHEMLFEQYASADAFVMTSIQEGMPVSALEAACCGLPIFSTRCGGVEDYVDDSIGRIYGIVDVENFANGLKDFLEERIKFDRKKIRKFIVDNYGKEAFIKKFHEAFESVL